MSSHDRGDGGRSYQGITPRSVLRCPYCAREEELEMPTDACHFFLECAHCQQILRPREGDCCVFCSYGSVPCPPIQATRGSPTEDSSE